VSPFSIRVPETSFQVPSIELVVNLLVLSAHEMQEREIIKNSKLFINVRVINFPKDILCKRLIQRTDSPYSYRYNTFILIGAKTALFPTSCPETISGRTIRDRIKQIVLISLNFMIRISKFGNTFELEVENLSNLYFPI